MIPANKRAFLSQFYSQVNSFWVSQKNTKYHLLWNFIYENIEEFQLGVNHKVWLTEIHRLWILLRNSGGQFTEVLAQG